MEQTFEPADQPELLIQGPPRRRTVDHAAHAAACRQLIRATRATRDAAGRSLDAARGAAIQNTLPDAARQR